MAKRTHPDTARDILYAIPADPKKETIPLAAALGRVFAEEIAATIPIPPFDRSPWDGYALRSADVLMATREKPVTLKITEELPAGVAPTITLTPGFAAKILTGAPMPLGADCTVKYENTEFTNTEVKIFEPVASGKDMILAGDDVPLGTIIARCGEVATSAHMGLVASVGIAEVSVFRQPRAAIISTGAELVEPGNPLPAAKIYNSSVYTLAGYLREMGVETLNFGVAKDSLDEIAERIKAALEVADIVFTTGGASVGDYDFALRAFEKMGAELLFWRIAMKPGGAAAAAIVDGKPVLALPGNPGAAITVLLRCVLPLIRKLCGQSDCFREPVEVYLKSQFDKLSERAVRLLRGRLEIMGGKAYFVECGPQGGGDISSLAGADLLAEIEPASLPLPAGALVKAWRV